MTSSTLNPLTPQKAKLIDMLVDTGALKFGDFTLKSGRKAPFFLNIGDLSTAKELMTVVEAYATVIRKKFVSEEGEPQFDVLFGPAYKGIPLATATAMRLFERYNINSRYCSNRKEIKQYGDKGILLGGPIRDGDRVLIVEDVTMSGKSIGEIMPIMTAQGAHVVGEVIVLDRRERAEDSPEFALKAIERRFGFPVQAILQMDDVIEYFHCSRGSRKCVITDEICQRLMDYYAKYGGSVIN